jgi:hypothetical protein
MAQAEEDEDVDDVAVYAASVMAANLILRLHHEITLLLHPEFYRDGLAVSILRSDQICASQLQMSTFLADSRVQIMFCSSESLAD